MKSLLRHWIWKAERATGLDLWIAAREDKTSWKKFIPLSRYYEGENDIHFQRRGVNLHLPLQEYTNWKFFAGEPFLAISLASIPRHAGKLILDIGANCGFFSLAVAKLWENSPSHSQPHIISFEPNPTIFNRLKRHLTINPQLAPLISPELKGLGEKQDILEMSIPVRNSGLGSLVRYQGGADEEMETHKVEIQSLDTFVSGLPQRAPLSFCKIDVECYEPFVLKGGLETLKRDHPCLHVEYSLACDQYHSLGERYLLDLLESLDYQLFIVGTDHLTPFPKGTQFPAGSKPVDILATIHPEDYQHWVH
ncbi:MAG: FkbM family methyltransferase [Bacteroidia bacterium]|nr:FkbM family methyltransferase [Bacteroidia bacterium]